MKLYDENNNNLSILSDSLDITWTLIYLTVDLFNIQYVNGDSTWKGLNVLYNFNSTTKRDMRLFGFKQTYHYIKFLYLQISEKWILFVDFILK